jgi:hypothetical protein
MWDIISNGNNLTSLIITGFALASVVYSCYLGLSLRLTAIYKELIPNGGNSLRDQIDRLRALFKASLKIHASHYMIYATNGDLIDMSDDLPGLTGKSPSQLYGKGWINTIDEDDILEVFEHWDRSLKSKIEFDHIYYLIRGDNSKLKIRHKIVPMFINKKDEFELSGFFGWIEIQSNQ